jgi:hypothetical protein
MAHWIYNPTNQADERTGRRWATDLSENVPDLRKEWKEAFSFHRGEIRDYAFAIDVVDFFRRA